MSEGPARHEIEEDLLSVYSVWGLNPLYEKINEILKEILRGKLKGKEIFGNLVRLRVHPPLLALALSSDPESSDWIKVRLSSLKAVAEREGFSKLAEQIKVDVSSYYERAKEILGLMQRGDWKVTIQVLEVGSIQEIVKRNGAFREMRGASLLVDVLPRYASIYVADKLGEEFILTKEAGELVFISHPSLSGKMEGEIIEHLKRIPIANAIVLKGNGSSAPMLKVKDIMNGAGSSYRLALASTRAINLGSGDPIELDPKDICRGCRADSCLNESSVDKLLRSFAADETKVRRLKENIVERYGGKICQSCLILASYGLIFTDILNGEEKGWNKDVLNAVKMASSYEIFEKVRNAVSAGFEARFVTGLENYDYSESSNALIAMITADGDGFGALKGNSKSIEDFLSLSILFSTLMEEGLVSGARKSLEVEEKFLNLRMRESAGPRQYDFFLPITPFYVAGDDMVLILRAEHVVGFIRGLAERAKRVFFTAKELKIIPEEEKMGISMGITAGRTKVPGVYLYDASRAMLRYTKEIAKKAPRDEFTVQASILYAKSGASWESINKFKIESNKFKIESTDYDGLWRSLLWIGIKDESPVLKSLRIAVSGDNAIRSSDFKEVLEDLLPSGGRSRLYHEMALLRWLSDIARGMDSRWEEDRELYGRLRRIFSELTKKGSAEVWRSLYTLCSILNIVEDRVENELGSIDLRKKLSEIGRLFWEGE